MDEFYDLDFPWPSIDRLVTQSELLPYCGASGFAGGPDDEDLLGWMTLPQAYDSTWHVDTGLSYEAQPQQPNTSTNPEIRSQSELNDRTYNTDDSGWLHGTQHEDLSVLPQWCLEEISSSSMSDVGTEAGYLAPPVKCLFVCFECGKLEYSAYTLGIHAGRERHRAFSCTICLDSFRYWWDLNWHCRKTGHNGFSCSIENCTFQSKDVDDVENHQKCTHVNFLKSQWALEFSCHQCGGQFSTRNDLTRHATHLQHNAFVCGHPGCVSTFTRYPDLTRHMDIHASDSSRYPCTLCKRHRGPTAFKRKDHLTQHLRNYHHVDAGDGKNLGFSCPEEGCESYRDGTFFRERFTSGWRRVPRWNPEKGDAPFRTQSALTKHLKKEHDESPFPCDVPFCDRVRGKGFTRKRDLFKHRQVKHPEYQGEATSS